METYEVSGSYINSTGVTIVVDNMCRQVGGIITVDRCGLLKNSQIL